MRANQGSWSPGPSASAKLWLYNTVNAARKRIRLKLLSRPMAYAESCIAMPPRDPSAQSCALRGQGFALRAPIGEALALLFDHRRGGVLHEGLACELVLRLRKFAFHALEFLVQARAFGAEVDEPFQRHEQLHLADEGTGRGRRFAMQHVDLLDAVEEAQLRIETPHALAFCFAAALYEQRDLLVRRHAEFAADAAQGGDHRLQPFDVGFGAREIPRVVARFR